jgi:hypothetical protein
LRFCESACTPLAATDEVDALIDLLLPGRPVLGPGALRGAHGTGSPLPAAAACGSAFVAVAFAYNHFLDVVVNPATDEAFVLDSLAGDAGALGAAAACVVLQLRSAYFRTYHRELRSVVPVACERQRDSRTCSLFSLLHAHRWLSAEPMVQPGSDHDVAAKLERLADLLARHRAGRCPCHACNEKGYTASAVSGWRRLVYAMAVRQQGVVWRGARSAEPVFVVPTAWTDPVMGPNLQPRCRRLYDLAQRMRCLRSLCALVSVVALSQPRMRREPLSATAAAEAAGVAPLDSPPAPPRAVSTEHTDATTAAGDAAAGASGAPPASSTPSTDRAGAVGALSGHVGAKRQRRLQPTAEVGPRPRLLCPAVYCRGLPNSVEIDQRALDTCDPRPVSACARILTHPRRLAPNTMVNDSIVDYLLQRAYDDLPADKQVRLRPRTGPPHLSRLTHHTRHTAAHPGAQQLLLHQAARHRC